MNVDLRENLARLHPALEVESVLALEKLAAAMRTWNARINLVSRKDMESFEAHHLLPCTALAREMRFLPGATVMDVGCGGGLPGLPLAALFPRTRFLLVDSVGKKITAVREMAQAMGLQNVEARHTRVENVRERVDFVLGRAVTALPEFLSWVSGAFAREDRHERPNGVFYWKGGPLEPQLAEAGLFPKDCFPLQQWFADAYFAEKHIWYFAAQDLRKGARFLKKPL